MQIFKSSIKFHRQELKLKIHPMDQTPTFYKANKIKNVRSVASFQAHLSLKLKLLFLFLLEPINKFVITDILRRKTWNVIVIGF